MLPLVFHPIYSQLNLPIRHRFPIEKYQGIYDALRQQGIPEAYFFKPSAIDLALLERHYAPDYVRAFCTGSLSDKEMRRIGFPWSEQLVERTRTAVGGTILTSSLALEHGIALNLTGGYHHAFADLGSGFCIFNDLYLAAKNMLQATHIERVLIVDCDVHQGDGTAKLAAQDPNVFTLSLHGEKNFPARKQVSDIDVPLEKGCQNEEYLEALHSALHFAFAQSQPDAVIYDAGVDVHEHDDLGHLSLTTEGVLQRDLMVLGSCQSKDIPVMAVIGGGYQRDIDALVHVHMQLFKAAFLLYEHRELGL